MSANVSQRELSETQISRIKRVEKYYGDLDERYDEDRLEKIIGEFKYSAEDERRKETQSD